MTLTRERPVAPARQEAEDLFEEAHRRRRRRRALCATVVLLAIGGAVAAWTTTSSRSGIPLRPVTNASVDRGTTPPSVAPDPEFTWVDYSSQLHIGNITTGAQQVVRRADANPTTPLVVEGDWIWWARTGPLVDGQPQQVPPGGVPRSYTGLVGFDRTTGRTVTIPKATQVFASLDRRFLYAAFYAPGAYSGYWTGVRRPTNWLTIGEYAPDGRSLHRSYPWPKGWSVATGDLLGDPSPATASGILVRSVPAVDWRQPATPRDLEPHDRPGQGSWLGVASRWDLYGSSRPQQPVAGFLGAV